MINSSSGTRPAGQSGQSGQLKPTPEALTYPPMNMRAKSTEIVEKERILSMTISLAFMSCYGTCYYYYYCTINLPVINGCTVQ